MPDSVTFGESDTEQTITLTAAEDEENDSGERVTLGFGSDLPANVSAGTISEAVVSITDDTTGITVTPASLTVGEGEEVTYTVVLDSQPQEDVTVSIGAPTDHGSITTSPESFTFTAGNWNEAQVVTVTVAGEATSGSGTVTHSTASTDSDYDALTMSDVTVKVHNDRDDTQEDASDWGATMTAAPLYVGHGYSDFDGFRYGSLTTTSFAINDVTYTVNVMEASGWMYIGFDREMPIAFTLEVDGTRLESTDASFTSYSYSKIYQWEDAQMIWSEGDSVDLRLYGASIRRLTARRAEPGFQSRGHVPLTVPADFAQASGRSPEQHGVRISNL